MRPELSNGQSHFWQWDTGQKIKVDGAAKELHYIGIDGAVEVGADGWAAVPDELLQHSGTLLGWAYLTDHTIERFAVGVSPRSKPPDYVYTPTEVKTWTELEAKIRELEESGVSADTIEAAVNKWLENNPITVTEEDPTVPAWAKAAEKPTYTAAEVGALSADALQTATENALAQAKASGAFDGPKGDPGDPGKPGKDGAGLAVTGATVGQIVKIAAVDETGVPTAWEPVDMPSGGGGLRVVRDITLSDDVSRVDISSDDNGDPFVVSYAVCWVRGNTTDSTNSSVFLLPNGGWNVGDAYLETGKTLAPTTAGYQTSNLFAVWSAGGCIIDRVIPNSRDEVTRTSYSYGKPPLSKLSFVANFAAGTQIVILGF